MFEIPLEYYTEIYFNLILFIVFIVIIHTNSFVGYEPGCLVFNKTAAFLTLLFVVSYMGLRPISGRYFGDMLTYSRQFEHLANGGFVNNQEDIGFIFFMRKSASFMDVNVFFIVCTLLYVIPIYIAVTRWHPNLSFFAFLIFIGSFSFWAYGTNGIRAGIASSLFICALSFRKYISVMSILFLIAVLFHKSMLLPLLAFGLTFVNNNSKLFIYAWIFSIVLSVTMGGIWEQFFANLGFAEDRLAGYLTSKEFAHQFSRLGFRWDFLLYSATAVAAGAIYIYKYHFEDKLYYQIYNTYLLSNAFWILVIRSSFSNRFAYLSWFLMAIVVIYPLLKKKMMKYQYSLIGLITLFYFSFTYVMHYIILLR